jgi:hypothetical protein
MEALKSSQGALQNDALAMLSPGARAQLTGQTGATTPTTSGTQSIINPEQQAEIDCIYKNRRLTSF